MKALYHVTFMLAKDHAVRLQDLQCVQVTCINCKFSWSRLKDAIEEGEDLPEGFEPVLVAATEIDMKDRIESEREVKNFYTLGNFYLFDGELSEVPEHKK